MPIEQLMDSLKTHEQKRHCCNDKSMESVFQSKLYIKADKFSKEGKRRDDRKSYNNNKQVHNRKGVNYANENSNGICHRLGHSTTIY